MTFDVGKNFLPKIFKRRRKTDRQTDASKEGQADGKRMMVIEDT